MSRRNPDSTCRETYADRWGNKFAVRISVHRAHSATAACHQEGLDHLETVFDKILREIARFRQELALTGESARVWDGFASILHQQPHEDNEGIEIGWTVGVLVVAATENGGGDDLFRSAAKLVDRAVGQKRWSALDLLAFRILGTEMLLRSCRASEPVDHARYKQIDALLTKLLAELNANGVHMPPDWRKIRQVKA